MIFMPLLGKPGRDFRIFSLWSSVELPWPIGNARAVEPTIGFLVIIIIALPQCVFSLGK